MEHPYLYFKNISRFGWKEGPTVLLFYDYRCMINEFKLLPFHLLSFSHGDFLREKQSKTLKEKFHEYCKHKDINFWADRVRFIRDNTANIYCEKNKKLNC